MQLLSHNPPLASHLNYAGNQSIVIPRPSRIVYIQPTAHCQFELIASEKRAMR